MVFNSKCIESTLFHVPPQVQPASVKHFTNSDESLLQSNIHGLINTEFTMCLKEPFTIRAMVKRAM